jgi:hypothetical protein
MRGIERFRNYLKNYPDFYVLIGGTACTILFQEKGLMFRATKDFDLVLIAEMMDEASFRAMNLFLKDAGYDASVRKDGHVCHFRFENPKKEGFPLMIELFSTKPDVTFLTSNGIIPMAGPDDLSDLSAILLNPEVYDFIRNHSVLHDGVRMMEELELIVLKATAWKDNLSRREHGELIKSEDIRKHFYDIARLLQITNPEKTLNVKGFCLHALKELIDHLEKIDGEVVLKGKSYSMRMMREALIRHFLQADH